MLWSRPLALIGLIAIPFVFYFIARHEQKRYNSIMGVFSKEMQERLIVPRSKFLSALRVFLLLISAFAFLFFLAGPKSTELEEKTTKSLGRDIFVLFDVSESMLAEDIEPNRLSIAKLDVEDFLDAALGDRIGLIAFSGSAQIESPLTTDYEFFRNVLRKIDVTTVQTSGTVIGDAIRLALERFGVAPERSQAILLVTDGEDHDSLPLEAARNASEAGVPIFVVAIGNLQGAKIPVLDASGRRSYKMFDGETIVSKPDVETLQEIAKISGGRYYYADSQLNLAQVYREGVDLLNRSEMLENNQVRYKDLYQPFLAIGLFAFIGYYLIPTHRSRQRRNKGVFISLILVVFGTTQACCPGELNASDVVNSLAPAQSNRNLGSNPRKDVQDYNYAIKLLEQGKTEEGTSLLAQLAESSNSKVASRSNYNLGVEKISQAQKTLAKLSQSNNRSSQNENEATDNHNDSQKLSEEIIAQYNDERAKRDALRHETFQASQDASIRFNRVSSNNKLDKLSRKNVETVASWSRIQRENEDARELELRAKRLNSPTIRLNWLQTELDQYIQRLEETDAKPFAANSFQNMFNDGKSLPILVKDVDSVLEGMKNSFADPHRLSGSGGTSVDAVTDSAGMAKIDSAKEEFVKLDGEAAALLSQYDSKKSRQVLRNARNQLKIIDEVSVSYPEIVIRAAKNEERETKVKTTENLSSYTEIPIESYYWNRKAFLNSVEEFERKAQIIVDSSNSDEDLDWVFEEQSDNSSPLATGTAANQSSDEQTNQPSKHTQPQILEERTLESAKIALKYQSELRSLIAQTLQLLGTDSEQISSLDIERSQKIATNQERTFQIMEEIIRPLQEDQQNNQNQQNQSNEQESQDQNQQNQNKSNQSSGENQDESSTPQNQPEDNADEQEDLDKDENSQHKMNENESRQEDHKKSESNNKANELTQEQKEAEALIRQVERRQKDAEEQRKFIQQALRKREKTRKDW